jgi:ApaG protein
MGTSNTKIEKDEVLHSIIGVKPQHPVRLTTHNVTIEVSHHFTETKIESDGVVFCYSYTITMSNHGSSTIELVDRHWIVLSGNEKSAEIKGPGVVGKHPLLGPGESFTYTSGTVINQPVGSMEGTYRFRVVGEERLISVPIPRFSLVCETMVH